MIQDLVIIVGEVNGKKLFTDLYIVPVTLDYLTADLSRDARRDSQKAEQE
ncbi:MAG: hypothetical protein M0Q01_12270 [Syntrophales bacterium]|jgi:hypothetical protein|nr:hypothetical protein [Syntrophales bacterium]